MIGVAFDGTGYGTDGTIWGGEFLISDLNGFERAYSVGSFIQAGGDKASIEGWRIAVSMIFRTLKDVDKTRELALDLNLADKDKINGQLLMLQNNINCIKSTSVGRLFDGVSALIGLCRESTFEGEAAMRLQYAAEKCKKKLMKRYLNTFGDEFVDIIRRKLTDEEINQIAFDVHTSFANFIANSCSRIRADSHISTVVLSGGVFQNTLLLKMTVRKLKSRRFKVLQHKMIPPNDGGIALGQALAAYFN